MRYKVLLDLVTNQPLAEDAEGLLKSIGEVSLHLSVLCLFLRKKSMGTKLHRHYLFISHPSKFIATMRGKQPNEKDVA